MRPAVALITAFVRFCTHWTVFSITDGGHPVARDTELDQELARRTGTAIAQAQVIFRRAALIAMALNDHGKVRVGREDALQDLGIMRQSGSRIAADIELV